MCAYAHVFYVRLLMECACDLLVCDRVGVVDHLYVPRTLKVKSAAWRVLESVSATQLHAVGFRLQIPVAKAAYGDSIMCNPLL